LPFIGSVKLVAYGFAPRGYANCDGSLVPIAQNTAMCSVFGTTYGGDGRTTFAMPNLQSRVPLHSGPTHRLGSKGGRSSVALNEQSMPQHTHELVGTSDRVTTSDATGNTFASGPRGTGFYAEKGAHADKPLQAATLTKSGSGHAHYNMQPTNTLHYVISTSGEFPSRIGNSSDEEEYLGDVRIFGFGFVPRGWAACNGQILNIQDHTALFQLLSTSYGGDGRTTFALPDLRGRCVAGVGSNGTDDLKLGETLGVENITLTVAQIPSHTHQVNTIDAGASTANPAGAMVAGQATLFAESTGANYDRNLAAGAVATSGQTGHAHPNMMPYLTLNFCICLSGSFPDRN
jgi:microcystin-dependent protein